MAKGSQSALGFTGPVIEYDAKGVITTPPAGLTLGHLAAWALRLREIFPLSTLHQRVVGLVFHDKSYDQVASLVAALMNIHPDKLSDFLNIFAGGGSYLNLDAGAEIWLDPRCSDIDQARILAAQ